MPLSKGTNDASWRHRSRDWTEKTSSSLKISPNSNYQEQIQREKKIDSDFQELDEFESLQAPPPSEVQLFMRCGWFNVGPITVNITTQRPSSSTMARLRDLQAQIKGVLSSTVIIDDLPGLSAISS